MGQNTSSHESGVHPFHWELSNIYKEQQVLNKSKHRFKIQLKQQFCAVRNATSSLLYMV